MRQAARLRDIAGRLGALGLTEVEVDALARCVSVQVVSIGTLLCVQGQPFRNVAWLLSGRAQVLRNDKPIGMLEAGDLVGEVGLVTRRPYAGADVLVVEDVELAVVRRSDWDRLTRQAPGLDERVRVVALGRLRDSK